jgi:hypothetical protein
MDGVLLYEVARHSCAGQGVIRPLAGGSTPAALRRAAPYGNGFTVPGAIREVYDQLCGGIEEAEWANR